MTTRRDFLRQSSGALLLPFAFKTGFLADTAKLRILFFGNSYTYFNNLPQILAGLAASAKPPQIVETEMVTVGGATLKSLWAGGKP